MKTRIISVLFLCILISVSTHAQNQDSRAGDEAALEALFVATNGPNWETPRTITTNEGNVTVTGDATGWASSGMSLDNNIYGVETQMINGELRVVAIMLNGGADYPWTEQYKRSGITEANESIRRKLGGNNLNGTLPVEIGNLKECLYFNVKQNTLSGEIPWNAIGNMTSLTHLLLNGRAIDPDPDNDPLHPGKNGSGSWSGERTNDFTGQMTADIGALTNLIIFEFMGVDSEAIATTGPIPSEIGNLVNLKGLYLDYQSFNLVPPEIGNLGQLMQIGLQNNDLAGAGLPANISNWTSMKFLYVNSLYLGGPMPDFCGMVNLEILNGVRNDWTGEMPTCFTDGTMPNINGIFLAHNNLTGNLPPIVSDFQLAALDLDYNNLSGTIPPSWGTYGKLIKLFGLSGMNLEGELPDLSHMYKLRYIQVAGNQFTGRIPKFDTTNTALRWVHFQDNQFSGKIDPSLAEAGNLPIFEEFNISGNNLTQNDMEPLIDAMDADGNLGKLVYNGQNSIDTPPNPPLLNSPKDRATSLPTTSILDWSVTNGADTYRVQISINPDFSSILTDTSRLNLTDFEVVDLDFNTTYYWRVQATNQYGTSGWSEVWEFTTSDQPPTVPNLVSPAIGATLISTNPILDWDPATRADSYTIFVSLDQSFTNVIVDTSGISSVTSLKLEGLDNSTIFYWKVLAVNTGGITESKVWNFTTIEPTLLQPQLADPADGASGQPTTLTLSWNVVDAAESYHVQVAADNNFQSKISSQSSINDTTFTIQNLENGRIYYWRVRASNSNGTSNWSGIRSFTTVVGDETLSIPPPIQNSPNDEVGNVSLQPTFKWEPVDGADYYIFFLNQLDPSQIVIDTKVNGTAYTPREGLEPETTHYWRVRAVRNEVEGKWSPDWSFTTGTVTKEEMETSLGQNYPNPFNPSTQIRFSLGKTQQVSLKVYDTSGRLVATVIEEGTLTRGTYERTFRSDNLASGIYFLRFVTENQALTSQMTLIK